MGVTMVINILLNLSFIPLFGIFGAAISALTSFLFMLLAGLWFVPKLIPEFRFLPLIRDLCLIAFSGLVMVLVGQFTLPMIGWIAVVPLCVVIYGLTLFVTGVLKIDDLKQFKQRLV